MVVNHRRLLCKMLEMAGDLHMTEVIRPCSKANVFSWSWMGKRAGGSDREMDYHREVYWRLCCPTSTLTISPYTPLTRSCIYADDMRITSQGKYFHNIKATLTSALNTLAPYYELNQLRHHISKTRVCAFHLRSRDAKRELNVVWNDTRLTITSIPVYLGIHLDRTLSHKVHKQMTKMKVNARNNIIRKLGNSKWGCRASTLRTSCLAVCYSAAEHACPFWARSRHTNKLNPALHECCRVITGCLRPANVTSMHLLAGIAPPHIWRTAASRVERQRQTT